MVVDDQGFNIRVNDMADKWHFGLIGCRELVPDIDVIAGYLVEELDKLLKLARCPGGPSITARYPTSDRHTLVLDYDVCMKPVADTTSYI